MSRMDLNFEDALPLELKLRVLEAELDRVELDFQLLKQRKEEIEAEIVAYRERLSRTRRRSIIRRVK